VSDERRARRLTPIRFVYLITDGKRSKVGMAGCTYTRMKQLQVGNHRLLQLVEEWPFPSPEDAERAEHAAHNALALKRLRGEWFDVHPDAALPALNNALGEPQDIALPRYSRYLTKRQRAMREAGH
jgi:hypothetical protein